MKPEYHDNLEAALSSDEAIARLIEVVETMKLDGHNQLEIYEFFVVRLNAACLSRKEKSKRKAEVDILIDILNLIYGYCEPESALFPHILSNEEIAAYRKSR